MHKMSVAVGTSSVCDEETKSQLIQGKIFGSTHHCIRAPSQTGHLKTKDLKQLVQAFVVCCRCFVQ